MDAAFVIAGAFVVALILYDIFLTVLVPRPASRFGRLSARYIPLAWRYWRSAGLAMRDTNRRDAFLGVFAPFGVISLLALWELSLIVGFALVLFGLHDQVRPALTTFGDAMYFAGTSFITIGFGDFVGTTMASRLLSLAAGATGLGTTAVVLTYVFLMFGAYQRREVRVTMVDVRAGAPPSGVAFLVTHAELDIRSSMPATFVDIQAWAAEIMDTHLAYPMLFYFRSSHDHASWVAALGAVLDAATLLVTAVSDEPTGQASLLVDAGTHAMHDIADYFGMPISGGAGVERSEFVDARARLGGAGYALRDEEASWNAFCSFRSRYAESLNSIARYWAIPPTQWIGDRSSLRH
ncbi:MAG TPA: potassium channel family protein [Candidatus Eremiobacteraceae bacterium]|nr:potassium channel family protein [Candidatus Eremiobacteraceae bacterium]